MLTVSGLQHYSFLNQVNQNPANYSLPIYIISNSSYELVKQQPGDSSLKATTPEAEDAHAIAYSAYAHRAKRAEPAHQYSEADCLRASETLTNMVTVAVAYPHFWFRNKSQIQSLQSIVKSDDCQGVKRQ